MSNDYQILQMIFDLQREISHLNKNLNVNNRNGASNDLPLNKLWVDTSLLSFKFDD